MEAQGFVGLTTRSVTPLRTTTTLSVVFRSPAAATTKYRHHVLAFHTTAMAPKREKDAKKRVVVTGMGLVSVFGNDVDTYYGKLLAGENGISSIDKFDTSILPMHFGGQIRDFKSDRYIDDDKIDEGPDDSLRYCIVAGKKALEHAALGVRKRSKMNKERAGVIIGSGFGVLYSALRGDLNRWEVSPLSTPYHVSYMGPALLAMDVGFTGPNYSVSAACATSNFCICAAGNHIREGEADLMIAGGVDASITPVLMGGLAATGAMSCRNHDPHTASRPWDKDRDGLFW